MAKTIFCCILVALACGCVQAADSSITDLSPGDFAAIDRRLRFTKAVSGEKIVDMLKVETQLKEGQMSSSRRTIGFLDN